MPQFGWFSRARSPSLSPLSDYRSPAFELARLRSRAVAKFRWKEIYASLVVISCLIMALVVIIAWNRKMDVSRKEPKSQKQEGPLGRAETVAPIAEATNGKNYWLPTSRAAADKPHVEAAPRVQLKRKATSPPSSLTYVAEIEDDDNSHTGSYDAPLVVGAEGTAASECTSPQCGKLNKWFEEAVVSQADPCRERNTFVCNASLVLPSWDEMAEKMPLGERTLPHTLSAPPSGKGEATGSGSAKETVGLSELSESCLRYAWNPEEGVEDILMFLSQFNLDLRKMADDVTEDPLERMIELSFGYGLDPLVSFSMEYNVTSDANHAFVLQISTSAELEEFFWSLERLDEKAVEDFYRLVLTRYALLQDTDVAQLLQEYDEENILNATADSSPRAKISIAEVSRATEVSTALWKKLLGGYCPFQSTCEDYVLTDERALALVAYVARAGETLKTRRLLAWHTLLRLVGAKADVLWLLNRTHSDSDYREDYDFATNSEAKCERLLYRVNGIRCTVVDMFEGRNVVPTETVASVANFMAHFQNAIGSIFSSPLDNKEDGLAVSVTVPRDETFAKVNQTPLLEEEDGYPFAVFKRIEDAEARQLSPKGKSFPLLWLRCVRAWHALPPLVRVLLPGMASVAPVPHPAALFRMPYYDTHTLAAYNFASLGQNDTWRQKKVNLSGVPNGTLLNHVVGLKVAYLALLRSSNATIASRSEAQLFSGVHLSSKELFLLIHCALSCALGGRRSVHQSREEQHCMVVYRSFRPFIDKPCARPTHENELNDCRYV
ncbi:hypothetical protein HPB52_016737 [Rhipicephalus sanguineus]|uniref:Uncharacterized protein n=1 Tax=Rhipicephalus sanguineus TaxID=34632 RepID=A0A9D4PJ54_RHISA|nr:hypothetical protein HPB52_016737 [Rhipicephalus sanguineus]